MDIFDIVSDTFSLMSWNRYYIIACSLCFIALVLYVAGHYGHKKALRASNCYPYTPWWQKKQKRHMLSSIRLMDIAQWIVLPLASAGFLLGAVDNDLFIRQNQAYDIRYQLEGQLNTSLDIVSMDTKEETIYVQDENHQKRYRVSYDNHTILSYDEIPYIKNE